MRLGLDIGTNSIGWWLYGTDAKGAVTSHIDGGVRIFGDGRHPKSGQSLAVARREARSARKRRDRYLRRRADLMKALAQSGLMPNDPDDRKELEKLDPTWTETLSIDSIDLEARLAEEEAFKQEALVSKPEQDGWETVIPQL